MSVKKGIILAGGKATRLHPSTLAFGKQFLSIYDKPMIYYPLSVLLWAGIRDILVVTSPRDHALSVAMLGNGDRFGVSISYAEQPVARGIADAFLIGEKFIAGDSVCLILCDNLFHGPGLQQNLNAAASLEKGALIFCYHVANPSAYGVAALDETGNVLKLVEKPKTFLSNCAVTGLYFYDGHACEMAKSLKPSTRGELEITDLNIRYLESGKLRAETLGPDLSWFDLGSHESIFEAASLVRTTQIEKNLNIGCPDEASFRKGFIDKEKLLENAQSIQNENYAAYLRSLTD